MIYTLALLGIASLCYLVIPLLGAFAIRRSWARFRRSILASVEAPLYRAGQTVWGGETKVWRWFGTLEAIEGEERVWLQAGYHAASLEMSHAHVYQLPPDAPLDLTQLTESPASLIKWRGGGILTEGIGVFVFGQARLDRGLPYFFGTADLPLLVVLFDGEPDDFLRRALWFGRQRNEYWNDLTPASLLTGFAALMGLAFIAWSAPDGRAPAVWASILALVPFLPLVPPGYLAFRLYRWLWRRGKANRAQKDLMLAAAALAESQEMQSSAEYQRLAVPSPSPKAEPADAATSVPTQAMPQPLPSPAYFGPGLSAPAADSLSQTLSLPVGWGQNRPHGRWLYTGRRQLDPMAESFLLSGEVQGLVRSALRRTGALELSALSVMGLGLLVNVWLVYLAIVTVLRSL